MLTEKSEHSAVVSMDNDLNRSLRMLEEALSVKGKSLLHNVTPKKPLLTPKERRAELPFSVSSQSLEHLDNASLLSNMPYENALSNILESNRALTGTIIRENEPWRTTAEGLFMEFYEVLQSHSSVQEVLEVVSDMARCCSDALKVIRGLQAKVSVY